MTTDKKRSETPYGRVEYDTISCAECTNDTVTNELTHLLVTSVANLQTDGTDPINVRPLCYGCLDEWYDFDTAESNAILSHDTLCELYVDEWRDTETFPTTWSGPRLIKTTHPTQHGSVSIIVAECARCGDDRSIDDLRVAGLPTAINSTNDHLQVDARYYCPDCQETSLLALQSDGPTFATVVRDGGFENWDRGSNSILDIDGLELDDDDLSNPRSWLKTGGGLFLGGFLLTMVFMAIDLEVIGVLVWGFTLLSALASVSGAFLVWFENI